MSNNIWTTIKDFFNTRNGKIIIAGLAIISIFLVIITIIGQSSQPQNSLTGQEQSTTVAKKASPAAEAKEKTEETDIFEIYQSKDPFEPLVSTQSPSDGETAPDGTTSESAPSVPSTPSSSEKTRISLTDIFTENDVQYASVTVGSTSYKVKEGDIFASNYKMLSVDSDSVTILYGDDTITLELGEAIYK